MLAEIGILVAAVAAAVAAFVALWATKENRKAIKATLAAVQVQLLLDLLREFSNDAMLESLQTLKNWKREYKESYKSEFEERYKFKDISVIPLNRARQTVLRYFQRMLQLYEGGYLSEGFCNIICNMSGAEVLFEIVEPFEEIASHIETNQTYDKVIFDNLRRICRLKSNN
jgi:hypothetical protein